MSLQTNPCQTYGADTPRRDDRHDDLCKTSRDDRHGNRHYDDLYKTSRDDLLFYDENNLCDGLDPLDWKGTQQPQNSQT